MLVRVHYYFNLSATLQKTGLLESKKRKRQQALHLSCCFAASLALMIKCPLVVHISRVNLPFILPIVAALLKVSHLKTFIQIQKKVVVFFQLLPVVSST